MKRRGFLGRLLAAPVAVSGVRAAGPVTVPAKPSRVPGSVFSESGRMFLVHRHDRAVRVGDLVRVGNDPTPIGMAMSAAKAGEVSSVLIYGVYPGPK